MNATAQRRNAEGWLAGICAGIANRFGWNVYVVRVVVLITIIATGGAFGIVTYALVAQFTDISHARYGATVKKVAFWFLVFLWSAIPLVYIVSPLVLFGVITGEAAAGLMTVLGVANGGTVPIILVVFCVVRWVRWRQGRASPDAK